MEHVISSAVLLTEAAVLLNVPVIVTEQYPKALLRTVEEIDVSRENVYVFAKTLFSMVTPVCLRVIFVRYFTLNHAEFLMMCCCFLVAGS